MLAMLALGIINEDAAVRCFYNAQRPLTLLFLVFRSFTVIKTVI